MQIEFIPQVLLDIQDLNILKIEKMEKLKTLVKL